MPTALRGGDGVLRLICGGEEQPRSSWGLSPDSQIARALCEAQRSSAASRTLEEIVAMAEQRSGWHHVFKALKAEGLLAEQTLGEVVARWHNRHARGPLSACFPPAAPPSALSPAPSRTAS